ncbi:hypothetical protein ABBQ32_004355 [Trebouxia sp. C0010 RCD-2024]
MSDLEEYEDDFETYDDDFESDDDIDEPTQVQTPSARPGNRERAAQSLPVKAAFGLSDAQRGRAARQWARLQQISQQVKLHEIVLDDLFDLPALTEYELFSMGRGCYRDMTTGSSQTNNEAITRQAQTDHVETASTACQVPESGSFDERGSAEESEADKGNADLLLPFLQTAGTLVLNLLGAQHHHTDAPQFNAPKSAQGQGVITGSLTLHDAKLLQRRAITSIACRDTDNVILAAYGPSRLQDAWHANMGCLCLWDFASPTKPVTSLISEGCPTACTFLTTPGAGSLVLAGMQEGGLCLWDCRGSRRHGSSIGNGVGHTLGQRPTYTTECHGTADMAGPVVAVAALPRSPAPETGHSPGDLKQTRFLALTEWGNVSLWSVHVLASSEDAAGVQADAGLQFGGHVRLLLLAASLPVGRMAPVGMQISESHKLTVHTHATTLAVLPEQNDQFVVAAGTDQILRGSLYGQAPVPKVWHIGSTEGLCDEDGFSKLQQQVTCLSFSPFVANLMVVGHSGGLIAVYSMHSSTALMVVQVSTNDICAIEWSPSRPSIVMALDSASCMVMLELTSQICRHRVVNLANIFVHGEHPASVTKLSIQDAEVKCANTAKLPCNQLLIVVLDTGQIKCCMLHHTLTVPEHDEKERMCKALRMPPASVCIN